jgi:hypothetical protein
MKGTKKGKYMRYLGDRTERLGRVGKEKLGKVEWADKKGEVKGGVGRKVKGKSATQGKMV